MKNNRVPQKNQEKRAKSPYLSAFPPINRVLAAVQGYSPEKQRVFKAYITLSQAHQHIRYAQDVIASMARVGTKTVQRALSTFARDGIMYYWQAGRFGINVCQLENEVMEESTLDSLRYYFRVFSIMYLLAGSSNNGLVGGVRLLIYKDKQSEKNSRQSDVVVKSFLKDRHFASAPADELSVLGRICTYGDSSLVDGTACNAKMSAAEWDTLWLSFDTRTEVTKNKGECMTSFTEEELDEIQEKYSSGVIEQATKRMTRMVHEGKEITSPFNLFMGICKKAVEDSQRHKFPKTTKTQASIQSGTSTIFDQDQSKQALIDHKAKMYRKAAEKGIDITGMTFGEIGRALSGYTKPEKPIRGRNQCFSTSYVAVRPETYHVDYNKFSDLACKVEKKEHGKNKVHNENKVDSQKKGDTVFELVSHNYHPEALMEKEGPSTTPINHDFQPFDDGFPFEDMSCYEDVGYCGD